MTRQRRPARRGSGSSPSRGAWSGADVSSPSACSSRSTTSATPTRPASCAGGRCSPWRGRDVHVRRRSRRRPGVGGIWLVVGTVALLRNAHLVRLSLEDIFPALPRRHRRVDRVAFARPVPSPRVRRGLCRWPGWPRRRGPRRRRGSGVTHVNLFRYLRGAERKIVSPAFAGEGDRHPGRPDPRPARLVACGRARCPRPVRDVGWDRLHPARRLARGQPRVAAPRRLPRRHAAGHRPQRADARTARHRRHRQHRRARRQLATPFAFGVRSWVRTWHPASTSASRACVAATRPTRPAGGRGARACTRSSRDRAAPPVPRCMGPGRLVLAGRLARA